MTSFAPLRMDVNTLSMGEENEKSQFDSLCNSVYHWICAWSNKQYFNIHLDELFIFSFFATGSAASIESKR